MLHSSCANIAELSQSQYKQWYRYTYPVSGPIDFHSVLTLCKMEVPGCRAIHIRSYRKSGLLYNSFELCADTGKSIFQEAQTTSSAHGMGMENDYNWLCFIDQGTQWNVKLGDNANLQMGDGNQNDRALTQKFEARPGHSPFVQASNFAGMQMAPITVEANGNYQMGDNNVAPGADSQYKPCEGSGNGDGRGASQVVCCKSDGAVCCASATHNGVKAKATSSKCPQNAPHEYENKWEETSDSLVPARFHAWQATLLLPISLVATAFAVLLLYRQRRAVSSLPVDEPRLLE